ncbi:MAG: PAS domain-containing protein [Deltaproteobacteria bacterium]|nr:PAS domain-containing protein [Deltaproteobacteria bacterium]
MPIDSSDLHAVDDEVGALSARSESGVGRDQLAEALVQSEDRLRLAAEATGFGAYEFDVRLGLSKWSDHLHQILGTDPEMPVTPQQIRERVHPEDLAKFETLLSSLLDPVGKGRHEAEFRIIRAGGQIRWLRDAGRTQFAGEGALRRPVRIVGTILDITERKRTEEAISRSEHRYRTLVEVASAVTWKCPPDGRHVEPQPAWMAFTGQSSEEMLRDGWMRAVHPDDAPDAARKWFEAVSQGRHFTSEHRVRRYDGTYRWMRVHAVPVRDSRGRVVEWFGMNLDISERKTAEERLRESEARFRNLANAMPQLVWTATADGTVDYYNSQAKRYAGLVRVSEDHWDWHPVLHPDDLDLTAATWNAALHTGEMYQCEHRVAMADGSYRWHLSRAERVGDVASAQWFGTATDIHDLKIAQDELRLHRQRLEHLVHEQSAELEDSHARLRLSERMAAIGTLAAGLGHDMGNILMPVRVRLDTLDDLVQSADAKEEVQGIRSAMEYLRNLAYGLRLLALDPRKAAASEATHLGEWWVETEPVFRNCLPPGVTLREDLRGCADCSVAIARSALTQAVFNLVQNAGDAMRAEGTGTVHISAARVDDRVLLRVCDSGPGMSEEVSSAVS